MSITLGELIQQLEARPQEQRVTYDFGDLLPSTIDSWRGVYAHLALGWEDFYARRKRLRDEHTEGPTVAELLVSLRNAVGGTFTGYKGGEFTMSLRTPVWCDNYGTSTSTGIVGVHPLSDYDTIIQTKYEEYSG